MFGISVGALMIRAIKTSSRIFRLPNSYLSFIFALKGQANKEGHKNCIDVVYIQNVYCN
jgi:hypothetical protein